MKKMIAMAAVAVSTIAFAGQAQAVSLSDILRQANNGSISGSSAAILGYSTGWNAGSAAKHAENTAKVHRFAGDAYTRATGNALYGGVGRASRNLAAALDAQGATIDRLNGVIAGEAARTATAVDAAINTGKARGLASLPAAQTNANNLMSIIGDMYGLDSSVAHTNLGTVSYDNDRHSTAIGVTVYREDNQGVLEGTDYQNAHSVLAGLASGTFTLSTATHSATVSSVISDVLDSVWEDGYDEGYADGYRDGYAEGFADGVGSVR